MTKVSLEPLRNALKTLDDGYTDNPNDLERDGLIQRFEYCLELTWKVSKKVLYENGIETDAPKNIFRELASIDWIRDAEVWFDFIKARNKASHIYNDHVAKEVFSIIPKFQVESKNLFKKLEEVNK